jgi:hypothetical protein
MMLTVLILASLVLLVATDSAEPEPIVVDVRD